jgi:chitin disaccharide deacetylase
MSTLVVTADDFGLCEEIDEAICLLHDRGVVRRTSLLVNLPRFERSIEALRARPALEVAMHLNVTDGPPVLPPREVPTLVDSQGCFPGGRHYGIIAGIVTGRVNDAEIHHEWHAQIEKARNAGVQLRELNAHGHLHLLPQLHRVVRDLRREFNIPQVRLVHSFEWPRGVALQICSRLLARSLRRDGVIPAWPRRTLGLRRSGAVDPRIHLRDITAESGPPVELIVHPSRGTNTYHDRWEYDGESLTNWLLREAVNGAP